MQLIVVRPLVAQVKVRVSTTSLSPSTCARLLGDGDTRKRAHCRGTGGSDLSVALGLARSRERNDLNFLPCKASSVLGGVFVDFRDNKF